MSKFFHFRRTGVESFKVAWKTSVFFRFCFLFSFVPWLLLTVLPFFRLWPGEDIGRFIPLHYNIYFGVDKFGPWFEVFEWPAFGFIVLLLNTWLAAKYFTREPALSAFLSAGSLFVQFLLLAAMYFTILLNM